jgi:methionyl aminopeptidase
MNRIDKARIAGKVNRDAIEFGFELVKPGLTLLNIDRELGDFIMDHDDCTPAFKGYRGFPGNACLSVNNVAVHGVPNEYVIKDGDLLTIDIGTIYDGIYADAASTRVIGSEFEHPIAWDLSEGVKLVLHAQMSAVRDGASLWALADNAIMEANKLSLKIVEDLGGHYIGEQLHMDPFVPSCLDHRQGTLNAQLQKKKYAQHLLRADDVICIEPVVTFGHTDLTISPDGWTCSTPQLSAHAEHMILVTKDGYEILS